MGAGKQVLRVQGVWQGSVGPFLCLKCLLLDSRQQRQNPCTMSLLQSQLAQLLFLTAHGVPAEILFLPTKGSACYHHLLPISRMSFFPSHLPILICPPLDVSMHRSQACLCIEQRILYWVIVNQLAQVWGEEGKRTFHAAIPLTSLLGLFKHTGGPCVFNMNTAGQLFKT